MTDRHARLKAIMRLAYCIPGVRTVTRHAVGLALQRSALPSGAKQRLFNFFARDVTGPGVVSCQVEVPGAGPIQLELRLDDDLSRNWYFWGYGGFEPGLTRLLRRLLDSKTCVFDVGANVGYYALMAARILEGRGTVHAFEPQPEVYAHLARNAQLNQLACLRLNEIALSDTDADGRLFIPHNAAWTNASLVPGYTPSDQQVGVRLSRFDTYCATHRIQRADLIKIDVEGAELNVLRGIGTLLDAWRPDIVLEVLTPYGHDLDQFFRGTPYRKFLVTDHGLREITQLSGDSVFRDVYLTCAPGGAA